VIVDVNAFSPVDAFYWLRDHRHGVCVYVVAEQASIQNGMAVTVSSGSQEQQPGAAGTPAWPSQGCQAVLVRRLGRAEGMSKSMYSLSEEDVRMLFFQGGSLDQLAGVHRKGVDAGGGRCASELVGWRREGGCLEEGWKRGSEEGDWEEEAGSGRKRI
jgi:hypothetical protein